MSAIGRRSYFTSLIHKPPTLKMFIPFPKADRRSFFSSPTIVACMLSTAYTIQAATLVNETFADGNRTAQHPPDSLEWVAQLGSDTAAVTDDILLVKSSPSVGLASVVAHFPSTTLKVGQTLRLSLNFSPLVTAAAPANNLSVMTVGIFDSNSGRQFSTDGDNSWVSYGGYAGQLAATSSGESYLRLRKRATSPMAALITTSTPYATARDGHRAPVTFISGQKYKMTLSLTRMDEAKVLIETSISEGDLPGTLEASFVDKSSPPAAYDTMALTAHGSEKTPGFVDVAYSNIKLEITSE